MIPVVTPEEMASVDRRAPEPVEVLIGRAGRAVARRAIALLGGRYGRRVVVVAGPGNNGDDGRAAAAVLRAQGVSVAVLDAAELAPGQRLPAADLVIDAAYGTGLSRPYLPPDPGGAPVLAVDIPSGLSGLTGEVVGAHVAGAGPLPAVATVTFAALKPGLLLAGGPALAGAVEVADIGLGHLVAETARIHLVTDDDVRALIPPRPRDAHKWQTAVAVVAGSPGMTGAAWMLSRSSLRAGAGYCRLGMPGIDPASSGLPPSEVVLSPLPAEGWDHDALEWIGRCRALVVGPGLGAAETGSGGDGPVARVLAASSVPAVVDADGINTLGSLEAVAEVTAAREAASREAASREAASGDAASGDAASGDAASGDSAAGDGAAGDGAAGDGAAGDGAGRAAALVLTPHAGEFARLTGAPPGADRIDDVRRAAAASGAVVLLKGSTTVVATPEGRVLISASGSSRLATAGTGDALSGCIGALLARGVRAPEAAALGAHVHGRAASLGRPVGLLAGDLPDLISQWLSSQLGD